MGKMLKNDDGMLKNVNRREKNIGYTWEINFCFMSNSG